MQQTSTRSLPVFLLLTGALHAQTSWVPLAVGPSPRANHATVYDAARDRVVLFGGLGTGGVLGDTWEYDGQDWSLRSTTGPVPRSFHAMAYDPVRQRTVLMGGSPGGLTTFSDTWEWDGTTWASIAAVIPGRLGAAMAFDATRSRIVVFGGQRNTQQLDDLYEFDGSTWTALMPAHRPEPRQAHAMVQAGNLVFLCGGLNLTPTVFGDLWQWNGVDWSFVSFGLGSRRRHGMAYDTVRQRIVVHGNGYVPDTATWEWTGTGWVNSNALPNPGGLSGCSLSYDSRRGRVLLFGGETFGPVADLLADTWAWSGGSWQLLSSATRPSARHGHAMVFHAASGAGLLYGGATDTQGTQGSSETWQWSAGVWRSLTGNVAGPPGRRFEHAMAYDSTRRSAVLWGGLAGTARPVDTWEWDGSGWQQRATAGPPGRAGHAMAFDPIRGTTLLFGGSIATSGDASDTWVWDGSNWLPLAPVHVPPARAYHAMAFDPRRGRIVLFGGYYEDPSPPFTPHYLGDAWEWTGSDWVPGIAGPGSRRSPVMVADPVRGRLILFGGWLPSGAPSADVFELDGAVWTQRTPTTQPPPRERAGAMFDPGSGRMVVEGGLGQQPLDDVWSYGPAASAEYGAFGAGCAGSAALAILTASAFELPWLGSALPLELGPVPVGQPVHLLTFGLSRTSWLGLGLPFLLGAQGAPGCALLASGDLFLVMTSVGGTASTLLTIPPDPTLLGGQFFQQGIVVDPGANPMGLAFSAGRAARIGTR